MISRMAVMILGLLSEAERHGYDLLREMDERGMLRWSRASKVGVYKALARLQEGGYLTSWTEKDGNLPEKRVYAITAAGEEKLQDLVYSLCSSREPLRLDTAAGLAFIGCLESGEAAEALHMRRDFLAAQAVRLSREKKLLEGLADDMLLDILARERNMYREELRWLGAIIARIEGEKQASGDAGDSRKNRA